MNGVVHIELIHSQLHEVPNPKPLRDRRKLRPRKGNCRLMAASASAGTQKPPQETPQVSEWPLASYPPCCDPSPVCDRNREVDQLGTVGPTIMAQVADGDKDTTIGSLIYVIDVFEGLDGLRRNLDPVDYAGSLPMHCRRLKRRWAGSSGIGLGSWSWRSEPEQLRQAGAAFSSGSIVLLLAVVQMPARDSTESHCASE